MEDIWNFRQGSWLVGIHPSPLVYIPPALKAKICPTLHDSHPPVLMMFVENCVQKAWQKPKKQTCGGEKQIPCCLISTSVLWAGNLLFFFPSRPSGARNLQCNTNKTSLKINWCFWPSRNGWDFQIWPMGTSAQAFLWSISEPELSPRNKILQSSTTKEPSHDSRYHTSAQIKQSIKRATPWKTAAHGAHCTSSGQAGATCGCLPSHVGFCIPLSIWFWAFHPSLGSRTLSWREHRYPAKAFVLDSAAI